jgi:hypothetical protein
MNSIGAFYQCYKRPKAVISVISSFRRHYPDATVHMVCDGGHDFSTLAAHFGCNYVHDPLNAGTGNALYFNSTETLVRWFRRIRMAAEHMSEDYILLLEDDVLVMNKVEEKLRYTINGVNAKMRLGRPITSVLKRRNRSIPLFTFNYYWGGFGGCIIDRRFVIQHLNEVEEDIVKLSPCVDRPLASDIWLSIVTLYHGGTIGPYRGLCETWNRDYLRRRDVLRNIAVLHQYKEVYDLPLVPSDLELLGRRSEFIQLLAEG